MSDNRVLAPMPTSAFIHDLVRSDTNIVITFSVNLFSMTMKYQNMHGTLMSECLILLTSDHRPNTTVDQSYPLLVLVFFTQFVLKHTMQIPLFSMNIRYKNLLYHRLNTTACSVLLFPLRRLGYVHYICPSSNINHSSDEIADTLPLPTSVVVMTIRQIHPTFDSHDMQCS